MRGNREHVFNLFFHKLDLCGREIDFVDYQQIGLGDTARALSNLEAAARAHEAPRAHPGEDDAQVAFVVVAVEQHQAGELKHVAEFVVHAHRLVRRPLR